MDELTIGDKIYISSKRAASLTGYAKDYVGQLCREGRVEATLVGRSWYVLETSIRAHRFGTEADSSRVENESPSEIHDTWEAPRYEPETTPQMPIVARRTVNLLEEDAPEPPAKPEASPETIEDMQSAWREWFATRQTVPQEGDEAPGDAGSDELEDREDEIAESPEDEVEVPEEVYDPIPSTPEIEEAVQLHRNYEYSRPPEPVAIERHAPVVATRPQSAPVLPRTRAVPVRRAAKGKGSSTTVKAALVSLIVFAAVIMAVGAGAADMYIRKGGVEYAMLRFLAGASLLQK